MNERIKELLRQASITTSSPPYVTVDFKKFAELIIKKCTTEGPFVAEVVWGKQFHKKILEHFGVEE